jgi:hypothetical protein
MVKPAPRTAIARPVASVDLIHVFILVYSSRISLTICMGDTKSHPADNYASKIIPLTMKLL